MVCTFAARLKRKSRMVVLFYRLILLESARRLVIIISESSLKILGKEN